MFLALFFLCIYVAFRYLLKKNWGIKHRLVLHILTMLLVTPVGAVIAIISLAFFIALGKTSCKRIWDEYVGRGARIMSVYVQDSSEVWFGTIVMVRHGWEQALKDLYRAINCDTSFISWKNFSDLPLEISEQIREQINGRCFLNPAHVDMNISQTLYLSVKCMGGCAVVIDSSSYEGIKFYKILLVDRTCWGCVWGYALPRYLHEVNYESLDSQIEFKLRVYHSPRMDKIFLFGVHCDPAVSTSKPKSAFFFHKLINLFEELIVSL